MKARYAIDTNLLVLLIVGSTSESYIESHKRTKMYTRDDYALLTRLLADASTIVVTPNVLSETSNLVRQFRRPGLDDVMATYSYVVKNACEIYIESQTVVERAEFRRLGLTDAVMADLDAPDITLITDDLDLYLVTLEKSRKVINFSHEHENWLKV